MYKELCSQDSAKGWTGRQINTKHHKPSVTTPLGVCACLNHLTISPSHHLNHLTISTISPSHHLNHLTILPSHHLTMLHEFERKDPLLKHHKATLLSCFKHCQYQDPISHWHYRNTFSNQCCHSYSNQCCHSYFRSVFVWLLIVL